MFIVNTNENSITEVKPTSFTELNFKERNHLQIWIEKNPSSLGEDLLFIQKEFDGFDDTKERLDLLALDKNGNLVIIENKLDDSGRDVTWQALKYASYCSTLSKTQIKDIYQKYLSKHHSASENAEEKILEFLEEDDFDEIQLNQNQRIILIANHYRKEVTSTVLWLMTKYNLSIQCFKVTPYKFNQQIFLDIEQIIPVKETEEFIIKMAEKNQEAQINQSTLQNRHHLRLEFWRKTIDECKNKNVHLFSEIAPSKDNWISAGAGISGLSFNLVINRNVARIELYISKSTPTENKEIFDKLYSQKEKIESEIDGIIWERLDDKKACRIKKEILDVSLYDKDSWDNVIYFFIEEMPKFSDVFKKYIKQLGK